MRFSVLALALGIILILIMSLASQSTVSAIGSLVSTGTLTATRTSTPTRTLTPVPVIIKPGEMYVHPSGLFSIRLPQNAYPGYPAQITEPKPGFDYTMASRVFFLSDVPGGVVHVIVERFINSFIRTVDDLNRIFDSKYLEDEWSQFKGGWKEIRRRTDGRRIVLDFEIADSGERYLARQISRRYGAWLTTLRLVAPINNPTLLDQLEKLMWPSFVTYDEAVNTPLTWEASIDPVLGYIIKYPANSVVVSNTPGKPFVISSTIANTTVMIRTEAQRGKSIRTEQQARRWMTTAYQDARIITVSPETRANAEGFTVWCTVPSVGNSGASMFAVLLSGANGTLYSAQFMFDSANLNLLQATDVSSLSEVVNAINALIIVPPSPPVSMGTLRLIPTNSPTPTLRPTGTLKPAAPQVVTDTLIFK